MRDRTRCMDIGVDSDEPLLLALLRGFPDRVARVRSGKEVLLANGTAAVIQGETPGYPLMVVLDAEDRSDAGSAAGAPRPAPVVRLTARVEPEWLLDLFPERLHQHLIYYEDDFEFSPENAIWLASLPRTTACRF